MKLLTAPVGLLLLSCLAAPVRADATTSGPSVLTIFVSNISDRSPIRYMQSEVDRLLAPGMSVDWREWSQRTAGVDFPRIVTVTLKGVCIAAPGGNQLPAKSRFALASTVISDNVVLPFAEVDCDRLRAVITPALLKTDPKRWPELMGRAMGRLVAHELYHMLLQSRDHSDNGLAKACFRPGDLTAEHFPFSSAALGRLTPPENLPSATAEPFSFSEEVEAGR